MKRSKLIKAITLTCFVTLLVSFVLYRTGEFDGYLYSGQQTVHTSPNGGAINASKEDSIKRRRDSIQSVRMYSSKSGSPFSDRTSAMFDSVLTHQERHDDSLKKQEKEKKK